MDKVIPRKALVIGAAATTANFTIVSTSSTYTAFSGVAQLTLIEIPNLTNAVTLEYQIADPNGTVLYKKSNIAENHTAQVTDAYPVFEGCVVTVTMSGVPGGTGGSVYFTIYYDRGTR